MVKLSVFLLCVCVWRLLGKVLTQGNLVFKVGKSNESGGKQAKSVCPSNVQMKLNYPTLY